MYYALYPKVTIHRRGKGGFRLIIIRECLSNEGRPATRYVASAEGGNKMDLKILITSEYEQPPREGGTLIDMELDGQFHLPP